MQILYVLFGLIQLLLMGYILYMEIKRKSPVLFLWGTLMIMFGIPHLISVLFGDRLYSNQVVGDASLFVVGFCLLYLIFRSQKEVLFISLLNKRCFKIESSRLEGSSFENICLFIFLISVFGYLYGLVGSLGNILNTSWSSLRSVEKEYVGFAALAGRLVFTFSGLSLYYFLTKRKFKSLFILFSFLFMVLVTRNRVQILPVFIFIFTLFLLRIEVIKFKHILIGICLVVGTIYLVYAVKAFRYLGSLSKALDVFSIEYINDTVINFISNQSGELGLRRWFYYFIQMDNNFEGFNLGNTYIRLLLVYLPMQWSFGIKPPSFDLYMGQAIGMATGGSMHPTLFGDCFGNLYWFGIFLGVFWAVLANVIDMKISKQTYSFFKILLFFLSAYSFVVIGRGSVYNGFQVFAWGFLIIQVLKYFLLKLINARITFNNTGFS